MYSQHFTEEESQKWFGSGDWLCGWSVLPDVSIDKAAFQKIYFNRIERWRKAFNFLANEDLTKLQAGDLKLDGDDLVVKTQEYFTKEAHDTQYEAHRKYADIQYVITGSERIGITSLDKTSVIVPYDDASDVVFLGSSDDHYRLADKHRVFVFLPNDAHRPCVKDGVSAPVRKIVVKVRIA